MADIPTEAEVRALLTRVTDELRVKCLRCYEHPDTMSECGWCQQREHDATVLTALLDEARKDRERLDWLQAHADAGFVKLETNAPEFDNDEQRFTVYASKGYRRKFGATLRAAIDQARGEG